MAHWPTPISNTINSHQSGGKIRLLRPSVSPANSPLLGAFFQLATGGNFGFGNSSNTFSYADANGNTYTRQVSAVNATITHDAQGGTLARGGRQTSTVTAAHPLQSIFAKPRLAGRSNPTPLN